MKFQPIIRSVEETLSSLKELGIKTDNPNTLTLIKILSEKRWTAYEISLLVSERENYDCHGFSGDKLADIIFDRLLYFKRRYPNKIFGTFKKEWFVVSSHADPKFDSRNIVREEIFGPTYKNGQKRRQGERSLRDLMFEILKEKGPLEQRTLVFEIKRHPDYLGMYNSHLDMRKAVNGTLRNCSRKDGYFKLFRKISSDRPARWKALDAAITPPIRRKQRTEALSVIMSTRRIWTMDELAKKAMRPAYGYNPSKSATIETVRENIMQHLSRSRGIKFERVGRIPKTHYKLWTVKKPRAEIIIDDRLKALDMLAQGLKVSQVIERLSPNYPGINWSTLKQLYDPPRGTFSINRFEGKSVQSIEAAKKRFIETHKASLERLRRINNNPEIIEKRLNGQAQKRFSHDLEVSHYLEENDIGLFVSRNGWINTGSLENPERSLIFEEKERIITEALESLTEDERLAIRSVYYNDLTAEEEDKLQNCRFKENMDSVLQRALAKLAQNNLLKEIR